jgi:GNAT superfamily N-acetyltransferase
MEIIKADKIHFIDVYYLYREAVKDMNKRGFYHWNTGYPNSELLNKDLESNSLFMVMENYVCIGAIVLNDQSSPDYESIDWKTNGEKVLYVHRMAVHPIFRGKGVTEKMLGFAEQYAKENNFTSLRLDVYDSNDHRIEIIKNCKFEESGKLLFPYQKVPFTCFEKGIG